jgi:hypothetical protein
MVNAHSRPIVMPSTRRGSFDEVGRLRRSSFEPIHLEFKNLRLSIIALTFIASFAF